VTPRLPQVRYVRFLTLCFNLLQVPASRAQQGFGREGLVEERLHARSHGEDFKPRTVKGLIR
jgi:hypothetical protein